ncbi:MAG: 6-bladed beta-propeller, partial [Bacteroidetes bacterium]|nr:6-bladed beta-propeller [Bacteroidota bacterium]
MKFETLRNEDKIFFIISIIFIFLASCSTKIARKSELVIFPSPPDTTRIQYLTSIRSSIDITGGRSWFVRMIMGEEKDYPIQKPYGISVVKNKIYICDTKLPGLEIIDLGKKTFDNFTPGGRGVLKLPINCFVDENYILYVADVDRKDIVVFDKNNEFLTSFGNGVIEKPTDVFAYKDKIYVADIKGGKIHVFSKDDYSLIKSFPDADTSEAEYLHQPTNIYIKDDYLYVTDFGEFNIKVYDIDGKYIKSISSYGNGIGQLVRPKGIALDKDNNLYVVDAAFENVQIFNP